MDNNGVRDVFTDGFQPRLGPYGCDLLFTLTEQPEVVLPRPPGVPEPPQAWKPPKNLVNVRMTPQHLKVMVFLLWKQINNAENQMGVRFDVPKAIMDASNVDEPQWNAFWGYFTPQEGKDIGTIQPDVAQPVQASAAGSAQPAPTT